MSFYCLKCGTQLPDGSAYCLKCGSRQQQPVPEAPKQAASSADASQLKCSSCGAPISPKFGEMVIACEYCGTSITLGSQGWKDIQKHTMLPLKVRDRDRVSGIIHEMMDRGIFRHHLQENSTLEEMTLSYVPYWIVPVSARTEIVSVDTAAEAGSLATTAALLAVMGGMGNQRGGRGGFGMGGGGLLGGAMLGGMTAGGLMGGGMNQKRTYQLDQNYNYPVVALKALTEYQPHDFNFSLDSRMLFDSSTFDKSIKTLNGDISEEMAKYQAKTFVDQMQSERAHAQYHMIQQIHTEMEAADAELLHAPIWFSRYDHKGKKIIFVIDANSGAAINSIGI